MRKLGLLAGVLFLALLVVAGGYGFYWYQVKRQVDAVVAEMRPVMQVEYSGLYVNPLSEIRVNGIRATPVGFSDPFTIDAISFRSSDPLFLMDPGAALNKGRYPAQVSVAMEGLGVNLNSPWLLELEQQAQLLEEPDFISPEALGCGDLSRLDLAALREMNIRRMNMDFYSVFQFDELMGEIRMDSDMQMRDFASVGSSARLTVPAGQISPEMMMGTLRMNRLAFNYTDSGYNQRKAEFCAARAEVSQEEYLELHAGLFRQWLMGEGIYLDDMLADLYLELNRPSARLEFIISPPGGVGPEIIMMAQNVDALLEFLNPVVNVNDRTLLLRDINWEDLMRAPVVRSPAASPEVMEIAPLSAEAGMPEAELVELEDQISVAESAVDPTQLDERVDDVAAESVAESAAEVALLMPGIPARPQTRPERHFQATSTDELEQYLGLPVRFYTAMGKRVEGRLISVEDGSLRVEQRVNRGVAEYPVSIDRVSSLEVFR
ncbi:hypothetical protein [Nitrincola alkalilacustris]|uniref:hypothetical protein n=1 Tax=Nitrincola alkalilacustris TaxID=1571224 RepID=UPI00124CB67E|nr:hypothetical protein [Nitrincola alkalilacustris]